MHICSDNTVSDRVKDRKMANIAASLVAAASGANGSIDDKERELNEMITGLQILREELFRRVSQIICLRIIIWKTRSNKCVVRWRIAPFQCPLAKAFDSFGLASYHSNFSFASLSWGSAISDSS